ncbi:MAG: diguanylate cyclase [Anaerolineaceae bacterium]|jgi:diguanylate cyclase (GGDEF)-like protein/PAS domain S-box-containing protein
MQKAKHDVGEKPDKAPDVSELRYRRLFETAQDGILILNAETGEITDVNPFLVKLLGYPLKEFLGKKLWETGSFKVSKNSQATIYELQKKQFTRFEDLPIETKDGRFVHVEFISNAYKVGKAKIIQCNIRDITEQKQLQALQEAGYQIAIAAETTSSLNDLYPQIHQIISSVMPAENFYITLYDEAHNLLRFPYFHDEADVPFLGEIEPGKGLTAYVLRTGKSLLCTQAVHDELERQGAVILLGVPSAIWLGVPLIIQGKTIGAMVVQHYSDPEAYGEREQHMLEFVSLQVALAISRKQTEDALRESEQRLQNAEHVANLGSWEMDIANGRSMWSAEFFRIYGFGPNAFEPTAEIELALTHQDDREKSSQALGQAIADKGVYSVEKRIIRPDGSIVWVDTKGMVVCDSNGIPIKLVGSCLDITARKEAEEKLRYLSTHDPLTGLYDRGYFEAEMARLEHGRQFPISIVMADVDHLKETNDREGHSAGDELLKEVARVFTVSFRAEDMIARIGGDEFAILLPNTGAVAAENALRRMHRILQERNAAHAKRPLQLSFGVSTAEKPTPLAAVLSEADRKMYADKETHYGPPLKITGKKKQNG